MRAEESPIAPHSSSPAQLKERIEAAAKGTPFLVYRDGGGNQCVLDLADAPDSLSVGRAPANLLQLAWDLGVSRVHAELERMGEEWTIADDGLSKNGTFVNGERLGGRRRLRDGDAIRFSKTVVVFCAPAHGESRVTNDAEDLPTATGVSEAQRRVLLALCRPAVAGDRLAVPPSNREIADELYISIDAVKTHLRALFQTFGVEGLPQNQKRAHLVVKALQTGIVSPRDY
jgi:pSer/pThr/pTyr-binding forkhead associated (FHA) protein